MTLKGARSAEILIGVVVVLVVARALLPWAIKSYINKMLDSIPGYYGHVEDVDVALYRGAYRIQELSLLKTNGSVKEPFVAIHDIEIALDWRALFKGRLVTKITLDRPELQFIQRKTEETSQTSIDQSWQEKVGKLYRFDINRFIVKNGLVRYKDETKDPKIDVFLDELHVDAENITNANQNEARLPSTVDIGARLLKSGKLTIASKVNLLTEPMEADINASLMNLNLKELNTFTKAYGKFDFEHGEFDATMELAASKTRYSGYLKTLAKRIDILDWEKERKEGKSILNLFWQGLIGGITTIFKNQKQDQFAARIPIEGSRKELTIDAWATVGSILKNAFVKALTPKIENSVDFSSATKDPANKSKKSDNKDSWGRTPPGGKEPAQITH